MSKIAQFVRHGSQRMSLGLVVNETLIDLAEVVADAPANLTEFLQRGSGYVEATLRSAAANGRLAIALSDVRLLPPIPAPGKIICLGLNYADHAAEGGNARPTYPSFFLRTATSMIGHASPILRPYVSTQLDFEAELAVVIGQRCRHLSQANALQAVAGYACFNDASVRDYQRRSSQWTIGKNFDDTGAFGPFLVQAADVAPGAEGLKIESRLNGVVMQSSNTSQMLFSVAETLRILTEVMTLDVGDVIMMGTPAGVGYARKPPVWMQPGDTIEVEIEGIGVLSNSIAQDTRSALGGEEVDRQLGRV